MAPIFSINVILSGRCRQAVGRLPIEGIPSNRVFIVRIQQYKILAGFNPWLKHLSNNYSGFRFSLIPMQKSIPWFGMLIPPLFKKKAEFIFWDKGVQDKSQLQFGRREFG